MHFFGCVPTPFFVSTTSLLIKNYCETHFHLKALVLLYAFEESVDCHLLSSFCDDSNLHISLFKYVLPTMGVSKESIIKILIGNRFHVKLRILSPYSNGHHFHLLCMVLRSFIRHNTTELFLFFY